MLTIELPYPHKSLWPNGRAHWAKKADQTKKHRRWAWAAMVAGMGGAQYAPGGRIPIRLTVSCKPKGPQPDKDGCISAMKAYLDGIADALGVNDNLFDPQPVHFSGRKSSFTIEVG